MNRYYVSPQAISVTAVINAGLDHGSVRLLGISSLETPQWQTHYHTLRDKAKKL